MRPTFVTTENNPEFARLTADPAASENATAEPTRGMLPPGLDTEIFDQDQLDYLADYYQSTVLNHLRYFYQLLRAVPPGAEPTPQTIGINAALLARLFALTDELADLPRDAMARLLRVRKATLVAQFHAIAADLRQHSPRADHLVLLRHHHQNPPHTP